LREGRSPSRREREEDSKGRKKVLIKEGKSLSAITMVAKVATSSASKKTESFSEALP
jgi:hypothetical protein